MSLLKKKLLYIICVLCVFFLVSCVPGVLVKPRAYNVKTVALASVSVNRIVREMKDSSAFEEDDYFKSLKINKKETRRSGKFVRVMSKHAADTFETKFKGIKAWKIMPKNKVFSSKAYRKFAANMRKYSKKLLKERKLNAKLLKYNFRTANFSKRRKMAFVLNNGLAEAEKSMLARLAKELGVDAVAVLEVDLAYTAEETPKTFGAFAGVSMVMVANDGQYAASTPPVRGGGKSPFRLKSDKSVSLSSGKMIYNKKTYAMFRDSIQGGIGEIAEKIKVELAGE